MSTIQEFLFKAIIETALKYHGYGVGHFDGKGSFIPLEIEQDLVIKDAFYLCVKGDVFKVGFIITVKDTTINLPYLYYLGDDCFLSAEVHFNGSIEENATRLMQRLLQFLHYYENATRKDPLLY